MWMDTASCPSRACTVCPAAAGTTVTAPGGLISILPERPTLRRHGHGRIRTGTQIRVAVCGARRWPSEGELGGPPHQVQPGVDAELGVGVGQVGLRGAVADAEP